jgi:hypothetical protein
MTRFHAFYVSCMVACTVASPAAAQPFATPPGGNETPIEDYREPPPPVETESFDEPSTVRVSVGPALRVSKEAADGGLAAAIDFGSGPAGARVSGAWVRVGSERGLAEYRAELFIDFGADKRLHPILGAGASVARLDSMGEDGSLETATYGAGILRGTLEYVLPVNEADARAGIDAIGSVPAIHEKGQSDPGPWLTLVARVGVGF